MITTLKVREKGVLILPKDLRQKAGIEEGSMVTATVFDDGIILSPKENDVVSRLVGLARISGSDSTNSVRRIRSVRSKMDRELKPNRSIHTS